MKKVRAYVLIVLLGLAIPSAQKRALALTGHQSGQGTATQVVQPSALKIVSPQANQKIAQTSIVVQYEQVSPAAASGTPRYELRLDNRDPVQTTDASYTFNGLTPGTHDLIVQIVDANNVPISGTRSEIKFEVVNPPTAGNTGAFNNSSAPPLPSSNDLPSGSSPLPLLSVIGFGILVGGVISALRTRPVHK
jgi:hypothetical protein